MADPLPVTPPQTPQKPGQDWGSLLKLLPLLALAGKQGGREGIAGFLQGYQQTQLLKQQQAMQQQQLSGQQQLQQAQIGNLTADNARADAQLKDAELQRRLQFLQTIQGTVGGFQTPEQFDQYAQLIGPQAQQFGIEPGAIAAMRPSADVLRQKKIAAFFKGKSEKDLELAHRTRASYSVPGVGTVPYAEWAPVAGGAVDAQGNPVLPKEKPETESRPFSLEQQYLEAQARGDTAEMARIKAAANIRDNPKPVGADNLTPRQQQQASTQARSYDTNQVVKNTQIMAEAVQFANSLNPNTNNPADDQALIYAFAKAMDPNSVVREGEYATVQKYAQSWAESFGFNAARIFSNTAFLTPQARQNMKRTIQARFNAAKGQYEAVRRSFVQKINKITNMNDGEDWLTDYGQAFPSQDAAPTRSPSATPGQVPNPFRR